MKTIVKIWGEIFVILRRHTKFFIPFVITAFINGVALTVLYLAPQRPFYYLFAPPIRKFWGDRFLHYPYNFLLLPKMFNYAEIMVSALIGIVMSAWAIGMIADISSRGRSLYVPNLLKAIRRYGVLFLTWVMSYALVTVFSRVFPLLLSHLKFIPPTVLVLAFFLLALLLQVTFIYMVPLLIIENKKFLQALKENFQILRKLLLPTIGLVVIPALAYIPLVFMKNKLPVLMNKTVPEIVLVVLAGGVMVSFVIDIFVTGSTTLLFLHFRKGGPKKKK